ncbi:MAG: hypothetical protein DRI44_10135 [Chlamydiae bacterium]|nr:MAG: hypothetical protein DRI44_10135 [Chlamydiota bacterium]
MNEKGEVIKIENGVATVILKKNNACKTCGLCLAGKDSQTMILTAQAQSNTKVGDEVFVAVDKKVKSAAIIWLLAVPIAAFVSTALIAQLLLKLSEDLSFLISIAGLILAFIVAWIVDKKVGYSKRPAAKIISN